MDYKITYDGYLQLICDTAGKIDALEEKPSAIRSTSDRLALRMLRASMKRYIEAAKDAPGAPIQTDFFDHVEPIKPKFLR